MNLEEFKAYAIKNFERASLEICAKAQNQRIANKVHAFDQAMEKNILGTEQRISNMLNNMTQEKFEEKKDGLIKILNCESIKAQCHKEVYSKIYNK